jgi:hypothetical protein
MKKTHYAIILLLILLTSGAAYRFGIKVTKDAYSEGLEATQAMLSFKNLLRYEELSDCLSNGKSKEAVLKLKMSIISEKELIAEFLQTHNNDDINKYISIRYPQGIESLEKFKSSRGSSWNEPACK